MSNASKQLRRRDKNTLKRRLQRRATAEQLEPRQLLAADTGGNTLSSATNLGSLEGTRVVSDWVGRSDVNDYFRVQVRQQGTVQANLDGLRADADLQLFDSRGRSIAMSNRGGSRSESISRTLSPGTYYFRVYRYSGDTNYRLTLQAPSQPTYGDNAGNSMNAARDLGLLSGQRTYEDFVGSTDRDDYYRFQLNGRSRFELSLERLSADADVQLRDSRGQTIASSTQGGSRSESISRILDAGTYYVRVFRYSGDTTYRLNLNAVAEQPIAPDGAGNSMSQSRNLGTLNGTLTLNDWVGQQDRADFYRFRVTSRVNLQIRMDQLNDDANVILYDASGRGLVGSFRSGLSTEAVDQVLAAGDYFVQVYPYGNANTNYHLSLTANTISSAGWASQTGYRAAETAVQRAIVQRALSQVGQESAPSRLAHSGGQWATDVAGGDGARIRQAFAAYDVWRSRNPAGNPPSHVTVAMNNALSASYTNASHRGQLVNRIVSVYEDRLSRGQVAVPGDDQQVLDFLGIRQQCVEWANASVAMLSGGSYRGYTSAAVSDQSRIRPGMALTQGTSHFMIITDVYWDANGNVSRVRVAESNYANQWSNPPGQRPWERTVSSREVNVAGRIGSQYRVISFE